MKENDKGKKVAGDPAPPEHEQPAPSPTPPEKRTVSVDLTAEEIYMIVGGLECLAGVLKATPYSCFGNRSWRYRALAGRLDRKFLPLLDGEYERRPQSEEGSSNAPK